MRNSVPLFVQRGIFQPEICRKVDDLRCQGSILVDLFLRLPMRQRQKEHIHRFQLGRVGKLKLRALAQVRMHLIDVLTQMRTGGYLLHLHLGVTEQQTQQFSTAVTRTTYN